MGSLQMTQSSCSPVVMIESRFGIWVAFLTK